MEKSQMHELPDEKACDHRYERIFERRRPNSEVGDLGLEKPYEKSYRPKKDEKFGEILIDHRAKKEKEGKPKPTA
jgi:hypothetical protein